MVHLVHLHTHMTKEGWPLSQQQGLQEKEEEEEEEEIRQCLTMSQLQAFVLARRSIHPSNHPQDHKSMKPKKENLNESECSKTEDSAGGNLALEVARKACEEAMMPHQKGLGQFGCAC